MTTNQTLYAALLDILRKDERGEAVSVSEFNALLPVVSQEYFAQQYAKFQETQNITDSLAPFIKTATITLTSGVGYLPYDYMHLIGKPTTTTGSYPIDVVTRLEKDERALDPITQPTAVYPIAILGTAAKTGYIGSYIAGGYETELNTFAMSVVGGVTYPAIAFNSEENYLNDGDSITLSGGRTSAGVLSSGYNGTHRVIRVTGGVRLPDLTYDGDVSFALYSIAGRKTITVYPTTITSISVAYLCRPVTPKLDYYVTDATNVRTFLAEDATHTADTDTESYPVSDNAPSDEATYTSETAEMEWLAQDRPSILYLLLSKLGITLNDQTLIQAGVQLTQVNDRK